MLIQEQPHYWAGGSKFRLWLDSGTVVLSTTPCPSFSAAFRTTLKRKASARSWVEWKLKSHSGRLMGSPRDLRTNLVASCWEGPGVGPAESRWPGRRWGELRGCVLPCPRPAVAHGLQFWMLLAGGLYLWCFIFCYPVIYSVFYLCSSFFIQNCHKSTSLLITASIVKPRRWIMPLPIDHAAGTWLGRERIRPRHWWTCFYRLRHDWGRRQAKNARRCPLLSSYFFYLFLVSREHAGSNGCEQKWPWPPRVIFLVLKSSLSESVDPPSLSSMGVCVEIFFHFFMSHLSVYLCLKCISYQPHTIESWFKKKKIQHNHLCL